MPWILWGALTSSVLVYAGLGYYLHLQRTDRPADNLPLLTQVFAGVALSQAVAVYALRPTLAKLPYISYLIIRWAILESIAVYGLVLSVMGAEPSVLFAFCGVTVLLLTLNAPNADSRDRYHALHVTSDTKP